MITHTAQTGGNPQRKVEYLLKDRLGSVDAVADSSGILTETRGYDAFGKPRTGAWADLAPPKLGSTAVTPKGFTQHEHLNQLELIHMNGRVYDYALGRFTGVDPFIQFPLNSQSLNPYAYILNNPLSGTDPTGYRSQGSVCDVGKAGNNANGCQAGDLAQLQNGKEQKDDKKRRDNGAQTEQKSTPVQRNDSDDGKSGVIERAKNVIKAILNPYGDDLAKRGEPGTIGANAAGAGKAVLNGAAGIGNVGINLTVWGGAYNTYNPSNPIEIPSVDIENNELEGAFWAGLLTTVATAAGGGVAARSGSTTKALPKNFGNVDAATLIRTHSIEGKRSVNRVAEIAGDMRKNGYNGPPIDVVLVDGRRYIIDGHHRAAAARQTGTLVRIRLVEDLTQHPSSFNSVDEVVKSAEQVGPDRLKPRGR